jgi:hypothetical protein
MAKLLILIYFSLVFMSVLILFLLIVPIVFFLIQLKSVSLMEKASKENGSMQVMMTFLMQQQAAITAMTLQMKDMSISMRSLTDIINSSNFRSTFQQPESESQRKRTRSPSSPSPSSSSSSTSSSSSSSSSSYNSSSSGTSPQHRLIENSREIDVPIDIPTYQKLDRKTPNAPFEFPPDWCLVTVIYDWYMEDLSIEAHCDLSTESDVKKYADFKLIMSSINEINILTKEQKA